MDGNANSAATRFWTVRGRLELGELRGVEFWHNDRNRLRYVSIGQTTIIVTYDCLTIDDAEDLASFMAERTGRTGYVVTGARDDQPGRAVRS